MNVTYKVNFTLLWDKINGKHEFLSEHNGIWNRYFYTFVCIVDYTRFFVARRSYALMLIYLFHYKYLSMI